MSKAAFKDKQLSSQPLKPRPRYYNEPHLSSSTTPGIVTESGHSNSPKPQELLDYSKNWSVSHNKTPQITLDQRREAVTQALRLSRAAISYRLWIDGLIYHLFPTADQRRQFETTSEYVEIQHTLAEMRGRPQNATLTARR